MRPLMCGTQLHTDARLFLGHHRVEETNDVDTFFEQLLREFLGEWGVIEHDGCDRMDAFFHIKSSFRHFASEVQSVVYHLVAQFGGPFEQIENSVGCTDNSWSE